MPRSDIQKNVRKTAYGERTGGEVDGSNKHRTFNQEIGVQEQCYFCDICYVFFRYVCHVFSVLMLRCFSTYFISLHTHFKPNHDDFPKPN